MLGAALCVAAGVSLAAGLAPYVAAALFAVGAVCDMFDGAIARSARHGRPSPLGAFTDSFCDKVGEVGLFVGLLVHLGGEPTAQLLVALAFTAGWLTSWVKAFAEAQRLGIDWWDARILGRATRAVLIVFVLLLVSVASEERYAVWIAGFTVLLAFNCTTLMSRLVRVIGCAARRPRPPTVSEERNVR